MCYYSLTILGRRKIEGCLCRVPSHFYNQVWEVLMRCPGGITVNERELPQQPTVSSMTRSELTFALLVESLLHHIQLPEYRQIVVEVKYFEKHYYKRKIQYVQTCSFELCNYSF